MMDTNFIAPTMHRRGFATDTPHGRALAVLWEQQLEQITRRMREISTTSGSAAFHADARPEQVYEAAKLFAWLAEGIVEQRTKGRTFESIEPSAEAAFLQSEEGRALVENTARLVVEKIWSRIEERVHERYPLIRPEPPEVEPPRLPGASNRRSDDGIRKNHFVPQFTVQEWADTSGQLLECRRSRANLVTIKPRGVGGWGYELYLYPPELETWFQRIESRAVAPYRQLLSLRPMTPDDRYFFITFLVTQHIRTPSYMARIAAHLKARARREDWPFSLHPGLLRRAHALLFERDELFASYFRQMNKARWRFLSAPANLVFPRTDDPVVIRTDSERGWSCFYPMSPTRCLLIGPDEADDRDVPFALTSQLTKEQFEDLCRLLLHHARRSFVIHPDQDQEFWRNQAELFLQRTSRVPEHRAWGPLVEPS